MSARRRTLIKGVAVAADILYETNIQALRGVEVYCGHDNIVRINVDGICAVRIRLKQGSWDAKVVPLSFEDSRTSAGKIEYEP